MHQNDVVGALSFRVSVDHILKRVEAAIKAVKVGESGYAFIISPGKSLENSVFLAHPNSNFSGKSLKQIGDPKLNRLIQQMIDKKNGTLYYEWPTPDGKTATRSSSLWPS